MRSIFTLLLFLTASSVFADSLEVRVVDPQSAAVSRATVHLVRRDAGWRESARVGDDGTARFTALTAGAYVVHAVSPGFSRSRPAIVRLVEGEASTLELRLEIAAFEESVIVTGSATAQTTEEVTKSVGVVGAEEIQTRDEHFIPEALRTVPGLRVQQLGGPGSFTSIKTRGLRNEDTAVLIDGARFRDATSTQGDASAYLEALLTTDVEQVEILRGTGSTLYGTNAGGGVINIVTSSGGGKARGSFLGEGGGLGLFRGSGQVGGGYQDRLLYSLGVSHLNVRDGVDGNDGVNNTNVQGRVQWKLGPSSSLSFRLYSADVTLDLNESPEALGELPDGIIAASPDVNFTPAADDPDSVRESSFTSALASYEHRANENAGYLVSYHGLISDRSFFDGPLGVTFFEPTNRFLSEFEGAIHTVAAKSDFSWGEHQLFHAGYEFEHESFVNRSLPDDPAENASTDVSQRSHMLFVQDQIDLAGGRLQIALAGRAQFYSLGDLTLFPETGAPYAGEDVASPENAVTGDVSGVYAFDQASRVRAHAGTGYRQPSLYERYGTSFSSFGYSPFGDPRLSPERTRTFDLGFEKDFASSRARASATYFRTRLSEIIIFDFSGLIDPATDPFGRFGGYVSTDGGTTQGLELTGLFALGRGLHLNTSYTFTDAEPPAGVTDDQSQAFVVPRHQFAMVLSQTIGTSLTLSLDLVATGSYLAPIFDPVTFASRVYRFESAVKSDLAVSYRFTSGIRLFGKVENLFDQQIYESGFRTPGRYALVGAAFEF